VMTCAWRHLDSKCLDYAPFPAREVRLKLLAETSRRLGPR
jgi:hypothetical protein